MSLSDASFKVIEDRNCPLYKKGGEFKLSGDVLTLPCERIVCLTLAGNIRSLSKYGNPEEHYNTFYCNGCTGYIKLEYSERKEPAARESATDVNDVGTIASLLSDFSFFRSLEDDDICELVSYLKLRKCDKGETIVKKGDPGTDLFIIIFGKVEVLDEHGISIAFMGKGEVFGEMSLLSGDPVGATIKVVEPTTILYIKGRDFRNILTKFPSLQMYFTRMLSRRLTERNILKHEEFASGMTGHLSEMPPSELFQALNVNQKTGRLILQLPKGSAALAFREGELVLAEYDEKEGKEAFYEMLKEKDGRFKFSANLSEKEANAQEIGDFMWLLMEGVSQMDEAEDLLAKL
ncbi:cyclic nucleotide-binding domain-containing protein [Desulfobacterales bacterium HSG2]|nr:cyclic nucleotide-binding domain-containing protein [Desulfobacterales bacterium HSG2]